MSWLFDFSTVSTARQFPQAFVFLSFLLLFSFLAFSTRKFPVRMPRIDDRPVGRPPVFPLLRLLGLLPSISQSRAPLASDNSAGDTHVSGFNTLNSLLDSALLPAPARSPSDRPFRTSR